MNDILIGIIASLISSIIIYLSSNWLKKTTGKFLEWNNSRSKINSKKYYTRIAQNKTINFELIALIFLVIIIINTQVGLIANTYSKVKIIKNVEIELKHNNKTSNDTLKIFNKYQNQQKITSINFVLKYKKYMYMYILIFSIISFIIALLIYFESFKSYKIKEANKFFDLQITLISPYISTNEILLLKSKWVDMESKEDFNEIRTMIFNHMDVLKNKIEKPSTHAIQTYDTNKHNKKNQTKS